ncbi:MAG TPA: hypothetical protein VJ797_12360 [Burkholderiales bacterium]|nr:hypothetical protein [Burkholderiales bacterium]
MRGSVALLALLAGCSNTAWQLSAGTPHVHSNVQVHASSGLATALGLSILAASVYEVSRGGLSFANDTSRPPEMDPNRKISEQDCSKPLDYTLGNIRCK